MVIIICLWDSSFFVWHGHRSSSLSNVSVKKEFYNFTKYSSLIDGSLNLIMFRNLIKCKACFKPLVDVVAMQGIRTHVLARKKSVTTVDVWITFFIEVTFKTNKIQCKVISPKERQQRDDDSPKQIT